MGIVTITGAKLVVTQQPYKSIEDRHSRISIQMQLQNARGNQIKENVIAYAGDAFMEDICQDNGINKKQITASAMQGLKNIYWSGNIRELRNIVERLVILCDEKITEEDIQLYANNGKKKPGTIDAINEFSRFQDFKDYAEKMFIDAKLKKNNWNVAKTSAEIDIQRSHLYNKIDKFDLKRNSS